MNGPDEELPAEGCAATALIDELRRIVEFHVREYDMHHATVMGCLDLVKAEVTEDWLFEGDDEGDDGAVSGDAGPEDGEFPGV